MICINLLQLFYHNVSACGWAKIFGTKLLIRFLSFFFNRLSIYEAYPINELLLTPLRAGKNKMIPLDESTLFAYSGSRSRDGGTVGRVTTWPQGEPCLSFRLDEKGILFLDGTDRTRKRGAVHERTWRFSKTSLPYLQWSLWYRTYHALQIR